MRVLVGLAMLLTVAGLCVDAVDAQAGAGTDERQRLNAAERQAGIARQAQQRLASRAAEAERRAQATEAEIVRLADRIQASEDALTRAEARIAMLDRRRAAQRAKLASKQREVAHLLAALQTLSRRPVALAVVRPDSVAETAHVQALLDAVLPTLRTRTATLRNEIARLNQVRDALTTEQRHHRQVRAALARDRQALADLQQAQRRERDRFETAAAIEGERAQALAANARDLRDLIGQLDAQARLRAQLAMLPGPRLRPARTGTTASLRPPSPPPSRVQARAQSQPLSPTEAGAPPSRFRLQRLRMPVRGELVESFGSTNDAGVRAKGLSLRPRGGAQVVAPAGGRVVFAGPFRTYDRIVIIDNGGGMLTLLAGLDEIAARVGDRLAAGSPVGRMPADNPRFYLEIRAGGEPVDPLPLLVNAQSRRTTSQG